MSEQKLPLAAPMARLTLCLHVKTLPLLPIYGQRRKEKILSFLVFIYYIFGVIEEEKNVRTAVQAYP